jgi:hypothetical protein
LLGCAFAVIMGLSSIWGGSVRNGKVDGFRQSKVGSWLEAVA